MSWGSFRLAFDMDTKDSSKNQADNSTELAYHPDESSGPLAIKSNAATFYGQSHRPDGGSPSSKMAVPTVFGK